MHMASIPRRMTKVRRGPRMACLVALAAGTGATAGCGADEGRSIDIVRWTPWIPWRGGGAIARARRATLPL